MSFLSFKLSLKRPALALLPILVVISFLTCAGIASAQTPPGQSFASALGPSAVQITFYACPTSDYDNCNSGFSIYRNPPGFTQPPVAPYLYLGEGEYSGSKKTLWIDTKVKAGTTYTYEVCAGAKPNSTSSNCTTTPPVTPKNPPPQPPPPPQAGVQLSANPTVIQQGYSTKLTWTSENAKNIILEPGDITGLPLSGSLGDNPKQTTTYTAYVSGSHGSAKASVTVGVEPSACHTPWAPPQQVYWLPGVSDFSLKWANPNTPQGQACPAPSNQVLIYRMGTNAWEQLAVFNTTTRFYTDPGPLLPGTLYHYMICEGGPPQDWADANNCSKAVGYTMDAPPVLTATRVNATTVQLQIAVDMFSVTSITVRRDGSDDPIRQGVKLGNGLMGCRTIGANGLPVSANLVTVYNWTVGGVTPNWAFAGETAPYLIDVPDDTTAKPAVEYYYQVEITWASGYDGESEVVTVPNGYGSVVSQRMLFGGAQPIKLNGGAPPPQSESKLAASPMASPMSRTITPAASSPMMARPTGKATAPPQSATAARPMMAPMMTPTTPMLQPRHPMSSTGPVAAPSLAQSATAARLTIASAGTTAGPCPPPSGAAATSAMASMITSASPTMVSAGPTWRPASVAAARLTTAPMNAPTSHMTLSVRSAAPVPSAANLSAAVKEVQQKPHDAQALYALGQAYCASRLRSAGVSYMYMALLLAQQAGNVPLASQIKASLAAQGVSANSAIRRRLRRANNHLGA